MPKISIIMPLYNAQKYLEESLKCVLNQTFTDYELLCINDASDDNTKQILMDYSNMDSRIIIFENQVHIGAANSRNRGIRKAKGKYIIFLDGDDIFDEEMLEVSYLCAEKNNTDVLMFTYKHVLSSRIYNKVQIMHSEKFIEKYCTEIFEIGQLKPYEFLLWSLGPCNKLFKKSFIIENGILFQDLSCSNDVYFVNMSLLLSKRTIMLGDKRVMIYARDHNTPSRISSKRDPMCCFQAYKYLLEMLIDKGKFEELYQHFFYKAFFAFNYTVINTETKNKDEAEKFYNFLQKEGIRELRDLSKNYFSKDNQYIDYIFAQFENNSFESKWYEKESILKICLDDNREDFRKLFMRGKPDKKIAIWGAGKIGKLVLRNCTKQGIKVDCVVDMSKEKQGQSIEGYCILDPCEIVNKVDLIVVAAYEILDQVNQFVRQHDSDAEVIDIHNYMCIS